MGQESIIYSGSQSSQSYISPMPSPYYLFTHPRFEEREYKTKNGGFAYFLCATSKTQTFNKSRNEKGANLAKNNAKSAPKSLGRQFKSSTKVDFGK